MESTTLFSSESALLLVMFLMVAVGFWLQRFKVFKVLGPALTVIVTMKKSRPAWELTVICREEDRAKLEALIFAETTTIGIRRARMERTVLPRSRYVVHTAYGDVAVKRCLLENGERCYVEYDSAAKLAQEQGVPLQDIYLAAQLAQKNIN